jgi:hypothetical protein
VIKIPSGPSLDLWEVDLDLEEKILQNEAEGVLASLVAGCTRWHQLEPWQQRVVDSWQGRA